MTKAFSLKTTEHVLHCKIKISDMFNVMCVLSLIQNASSHFVSDILFSASVLINERL